MTWGFERGCIYNRKSDIHDVFGGQQQGGIITPAEAAVVIAITGEKGIGHGYDDRELPDSTFEYFGAGRLGPMKLTDRNKGLLEHSQNGKSLLLFRDESRKRLRFLGEYICDGFEWRDAPDESKAIRPAIVFKLVPLDKINETVDACPKGDVPAPPLPPYLSTNFESSPRQRLSLPFPRHLEWEPFTNAAGLSAHMF